MLLPNLSAGVLWGDVFTSHEIWSPAVRRVWQQDANLAAVTGLAAPALIRSGYPGTCAVFIVDDSAVLKFFPPFAHSDYQRESYVLEHLSQRVDKLPSLISGGVFEDRIAWPYLVTAFEPGEVWRDKFADLSAPDRANVAAELGRTVRKLHAQHWQVNELWPRLDSWGEFVRARLAAIPGELASMPLLTPEVAGEAVELMSEADWQTVRPSLVHADLTEDHILIETADRRWSLSCIIDWADAEVATPDYEWVALWFGFCQRDPELFRVFLSAYDPKSRFDAQLTDRLLAHTFLHRFGSAIIADILADSAGPPPESLSQLKSLLFAGLP